MKEGKREGVKEGRREGKLSGVFSFSFIYSQSCRRAASTFHHSSTPPLHHSSTPPLPHSSTPPLPHSPTPPLPHSPTPPLPQPSLLNYTHSGNHELNLLVVVLMQFRGLIVLCLLGFQPQFMVWQRHQL